ncbi:MAG TPA: hypothetical protein PLM29_12785, partial [Deltaproteobacteria bacterium]|nr:hypothetical protein [Deltaproteobacteria bacterium]
LLTDLIDRYKKPIIPVVDIIAFDVSMDNNPLDILDKRGIMAYTSPAPAINALAKVVEYSRRTDCKVSSEKPCPGRAAIRTE